jgi:5-amino-6-(5-phospho-D-ribitylamino)uracil phosphatase
VTRATPQPAEDTPAACNYDLLALDLDGTVFNSRGEPPRENLEAIERAMSAGLRVVICTSRGLREAGRAVEAIKPVEPMIVAGGAMCVDPRTGHTLHRSVVDAEVIREVSELLIELGHRVLLLKDPEAAGIDYLAVGSAPMHSATTWWFERMGLRVAEVARPEDDPHPEQTVRAGIVTSPEQMLESAARIRARLGDRALIQHFPAVSGDASGGLDRSIEILELFDPQVSKWSGLSWLAAREGIAPERVAAIGDEINDLEMIQRSGLGVAMGNAAQAVRDAADQVTLSNDDAGVAHAIERILTGRW